MQCTQSPLGPAEGGPRLDRWSEQAQEQGSLGGGNQPTGRTRKGKQEMAEMGVGERVTVVPGQKDAFATAGAEKWWLSVKASAGKISDVLREPSSCASTSWGTGQCPVGTYLRHA